MKYVNDIKLEMYPQYRAPTDMQPNIHPAMAYDSSEATIFTKMSTIWFSLQQLDVAQSLNFTQNFIFYF